MTSQLIQTHRENAEIFTDHAICKQKTKEMLKKISLPSGLLPLDNITEFGYNQTTGFMWVKQTAKKEHTFKAVNRKTIYDTEVTAFIGEREMKKLTGVKTKELMIWVSLNSIRIDDPSSGKIIFGAPAGITKSFPASAFEEEAN